MRVVRFCFGIFLLCLWLSKSLGQLDSVLINQVDALNQLSEDLHESHLDSSITLALEAIDLAKRGNYELGEAIAYDRLGFCMDRKADFQQAIEYYSRSAIIKERIGQGNPAYSWGEIGFALSMLGKEDSAIYYFEKSRQLGIENNDHWNIALQGSRIGKIYLAKEDLASAKSEFENSLRLGEIINNHFVKAEALFGLHSLYTTIDEHKKAKQIAERYLVEAKNSKDHRIISTGYRLLGISQWQFNDSDAAKYSYRVAKAISDSIETVPAQIESRLDLGDILLLEDSLDLALTLFREAKHMATVGQLELMRISSAGREAMALVELGKPREAITLGLTALESAKQQKGLRIQEQPLKVLWKANKALGNAAQALLYHEQWTNVQDSIRNEDFAKATLRSELEKQHSVRILQDSLAYAEERHAQQLAYDRNIQAGKRKRNGILFAGGGLLLLAIGLWSRLRYTRRANIAIKNEKEISEGLLLNILPEKVAEELKEKGEAEAQLMDQVTVLFTDFKGFTTLSEKLSPKELVNDLNLCFSEFDRITAKFGIEKIKTIGDAYMAAGGLPTPNSTHADDILKAALEMRDFVEGEKQRKIEAGLPYFEIRIGVHTGPVVAGIVGVKKFQYDIWGDTVNTASRMESSGEVGKVNISESTYELVKDSPDFSFESRGKIQAKGKGELEMYFVYRTM